MAAASIRTLKAGESCQEEVFFSVDDSFHSSNQYLELSTVKDADIYYTLDGSSPAQDSILYTEPILLVAEEETKATVVKAMAVYSENEWSEIYTRTYFTGRHIEDRFTTMVVSISCNPEELYGYESGILVPGKLRDDYVYANPDVEVSDTAPANYNLKGMVSERRAYVEIWDMDGSKVVDQNIGIRVHGGVSRSSDMKSFRLIARNEYGKDRIFYELFPEKINAADETTITQYKRIILRNHGNDQERAYLRNELGERLAADAGFRDTQACRAAAVYLNGEYYGFEWMQEYYDEVYLHTNYGTNEGQGDWQIVTPHRGNADTESEDEALAQAAQDLNALYAYSSLDLRDDAVFAELKEQLDVENFLHYCAIEIYLANPDWPDNNCKAYRWYSQTGAYVNPYADGKWRYLLYDLDVGMARTGSSEAGNPTIGECLGYIEGHWDRTSPLLKAILRREDMQERFIQLVEELMEGAFSYEHACYVIDEIQQEMEAELDIYIRQTAIKEAKKEGGNWEELYYAQMEEQRIEIEKIKEFFRLRPDSIREELNRLSEYVEHQNM